MPLVAFMLHYTNYNTYLNYLKTLTASPRHPPALPTRLPLHLRRDLIQQPLNPSQSWDSLSMRLPASRRSGAIPLQMLAISNGFMREAP